MTQITRNQFAGMIDYSLLRADCSRAAVEKLCAEAIECGFAAVCAPPNRVAQVAAALSGRQTKVCTVVGFPLGHQAASVKLAEAETALMDGAEEIDAVMAVGRFLDGELGPVRLEIKRLVEVVNPNCLKIIIETCYLNAKQIAEATRLAADAGADFVKTSTGFGLAGASVEAVRIMAAEADGKALIKAAGGISTLDAALAMIEAGAARIGTSSAIAMMKEWDSRNG